MLQFVPAWLRRSAALAALLAAPLLATAQNVGIGTTQPTQTLDVNGGVRVRGAAGTGTRLLQADATGTLSPAATTLPAGTAVTPALAGTATGLSNPLVAASGALAVVLNRGASPISLSAYDVSAPASPTLRGTYTGTGLGSVNTSSAAGTPLAMSGTVAAVFQNTSPYQVSVFALGSGAPTLASTITLPAATSGYYAGVAMTGNLLFVTSDQSGGGRGYFYVYDVSNPAAPVQRNGNTNNTGFFTPTYIAAAGTLVCVSAPYGATTAADHFNVLDVSNPAAPAVVGTNGGTTTATYTNSARPLAMSPGLVVELQPENNLLSAYDLSTPSAPTLRCTYTTATNPVGVALSGSLAYVACAGTSQLQVVDVSGATAVLRGTTSLDATAQSVAATSALVLAANKAAANDLQVFTLPTRTLVVYPDGSAASAASPGAADFIQNQTAAAQTGGFNVSSTGTVGGALTVGGAAALNGGAAIAGPATVSGTTTLAGATTVNNSLQVYGTANLAGGATISSATISGSASVGTTLTVSGPATVSGTTTLNGAATVNNNATITGTATITGATKVGSTFTVGASGAPGKVLTPATGTHNMLAVAYGQVGGSPVSIYGNSGNYSVTRTGAGAYTITFSASSGLSAVSLDTYPIVMSLYGSGPGFVGWTTTTNGTLSVTTYNSSGTAADAYFNFVVFQP